MSIGIGGFDEGRGLVGSFLCDDAFKRVEGEEEILSFFCRLIV